MKRSAGTLFANYDSGYGSVRLNAEFLAETPLMRADVLRDWITQLQEAYSVARSDMHREWMDARANAERTAIANTVANTADDASDKPNNDGQSG